MLTNYLQTTTMLLETNLISFLEVAPNSTVALVFKTINHFNHYDLMKIKMNEKLMINRNGNKITKKRTK